MEKQSLTPDAYPLTLNSLTTACNQSSSRDPVVSYDHRTVEAAVLTLKAMGLARVVHPGSGERATKYRHVVDEVWGVDAAEQAVLAVLLLRGAQTVAELRARTERMRPFSNTSDLEAVLEHLAARPEPLVRRLERRAGHKEPRWIQLIEDDPYGATGEEPAEAAPAGSRRSDRVGELETQVEELLTRVANLEASLERLERALGA